jgi:chromosome segregation protein
LFIEELNLKNFKSFKNATLRFEKGFNLILGPNGSGKSNVVDALRFVFGESSLKSVRAKNVSQLIFNNGGMAEIELKLKSGEEAHVLKRFIRKDGKTKYKLDGKTVKKYDVSEFLSVNRLYMSNFIIQGAIERIVQMSGRDRRGLIDDVSNVGEYENKKQEAMRELGVVQKNLDEANVSLGERKGYLTELKRDKEEAEKFLRLKRERDELEASLVFIELRILELDLEKVVSGLSAKKDEIEKIKGEMMLLSGEITEKTAKLNDINMKILAGSEGEKAALDRQVFEFESRITELKNRLLELKSSMDANYYSKKELDGKILRATDDLNGLNSQMKEKEKELSNLNDLVSENEKKVEEKEKNSNLFGKDYYELKLFIQNTESEISALNLELQKLQGESAELEGFKKAKLTEIELFKKGVVESSEEKLDKLNENRKNLKAKLKSLDSGLNDLILNEKKLNERKTFLEGEFLKGRERIGALAFSSSSVSGVNEALKGFKGVFGVVGELCDYEGLTIPVEVALGGRFNFFVVENADIAIKAVNFLRSNNLGRASFIPLDKIRIESRSDKVEKIVESLGKECKGFLVDLVSFEKKFDNVFKFAFGDTILVESVDSCKPFIGKARMVTKTGELFETSGLVSGGSWKSSGVALKKEWVELDGKIKKIDSERKSVLKELDDLKSEVEKLRHEKSGVEVEIQVLDFEEKTLVEKTQKAESAEKNRKEKLKLLNEELKLLDEGLDEKTRERKNLIKKISELNINLVDARSKVDVEREKDLGLELKELEKRLSSLKNSRSDLNAEVKVLKTRIGFSEKEMESLKKELEKKTRDKNDFEKSFATAESEIKILSKKLEESREKLKVFSSNKTDLEKQKESIANEIAGFSNKRGALNFKKDELEADVQKLLTSKAVNETNLANKKEQFAVFEGLNLTFDVDSSDKPRLISRLKEVNSDIPDENNINLKAIEEFGLKAGEVEELSGKVSVLEGERTSIMSLIEETEEKKISTFMSVFNFVNSNFKILFSQIFNGEGFLVLDDDSNPFNGGLSIKVNLKNKGVSFLDLMSGGEKSLIALIFLFSIQSYNPSSVYVLDEADAALDHENAFRLSMLIKKLSGDSQFFVISHNQSVFKEADCLIGVSMVGGESKLVEVSVSESE